MHLRQINAPLSESKLLCVTCVWFWCSSGSVSLSQETDGSDFKTKLLIGLPKVCDLDVHERKLLNLRCVDLQNSFTVTFTIL